MEFLLEHYQAYLNSLVSFNESDTDEIQFKLFLLNTLKYLFLVYIYRFIPIDRLFIWR